MRAAELLIEIGAYWAVRAVRARHRRFARGAMRTPFASGTVSAIIGILSSTAGNRSASWAVDLVRFKGGALGAVLASFAAGACRIRLARQCTVIISFCIAAAEFVIETSRAALDSAFSTRAVLALSTLGDIRARGNDRTRLSRV